MCSSTNYLVDQVISHASPQLSIEWKKVWYVNPISFSDIFTDITNSDNLQSRHNDYNYVVNPAVKKYLELFPLKQILFNWNSLNIDLKATADAEEFKLLMKNSLCSQYNH